MSEMTGSEEWTTETLTTEIVENSVHQNLMELRLNTEDYEDLMSQFSIVKGMAQHVRKVSDDEGLHVLHVFRDKIVNIVKDYSCCSKGCSWCCNMAVGITSLDAENIYKATGIQPKEVVLDEKKLSETRDEQVNKYMRVPCPFLSKGACTVYESRPSACRTHFNISKFPQVCDLDGFEGRDVPNLDMRDLWITEAMICYKLNATMGDIRLYFPHVQEGKLVSEE